MKKFLLSLATLLGIATSASADVALFYVGEKPSDVLANTSEALINGDTGVIGKTYTSGDITISFTKNNNNNSNVNGDALRWYQGDVLNITPAEGCTITEVSVNAVPGNETPFTSNSGTVTEEGNNPIIWTGSTTETLELTSIKQIRFYYFTVTYSAPADDTPWTVAQALEFLQGGQEGDAVVKGFVTEITDLSTSYGNATYKIADSMEEGSAELIVYRGYYLEGNKFTSEDQLQVGATVVVSGKLVNFNGTYEFTSGSQILSYTAPEGEGESEPWTVAQALSELAGGFSGEATVKGYIKEISELSTSYGNATYSIADSMEDGAPTLLVYRGYSLDGEKFTSEDEIEIGGLVVVSGSLKDYNGTLEFTTGSKILSYTAPEGDVESEPWTVAQALSELAGGFSGEATVKGYIKEISELSTSYGNATYSIADSMEDGDPTLLVYRGYSLNGEKFTSEDEIEVGGLVVVSGSLTDYNGTYEFATGSQILSYTAPEVDDTPSTPDTELTDNIKNLKVGDELTATAIVTAQNATGFVITDQAGSILVYNSAIVADYPIGTIVSVSGTVSNFGKGLQLTQDATVEKVGEGTVTYPEPIVYTASMIDEAAANPDNVLSTYVQVTGTLAISGIYYNIDIDGASIQGSVSSPDEALKAQLTDGESYTFTGYFTGITGSKTQFFNIVVTDVEPIENGDTDPEYWTVAHALEFLQGGQEGDAVVKGIISEVKSIDTGSYGNAEYSIVDALGDAQSLLVYRGYYLDGEKFTSDDQLQVGATVVVSGKLLNYNGTYEFTSGSQILSYTAPEGGDNPNEPTPEVPVWTVSEALDQIDALYQGNASVEGYIVSIKEINVEYGNATYTIADDMSYTTGLTIFRGKFIEGEKFTASNQIAVGGKVVVNGYLTIYDSTPEMTQSRILEYVEPEGGNPETPDQGGVVTVIYEETFAESLGGFTMEDVVLPEGSTYVWKYDSSYHYAKASSFVGGSNKASESWLVSPEIDLANYTDIFINFETALKLFTENVEATDYVGIYVGEAGSVPSVSGWTNLSNEVESFGTGTNYDFLNSGDVPVPDGFNGKKVQFGFYYVSTTECAPTWEIKNITVSGTTVGSGAVDGIATDLDSPIEYYTLQGIKVNNPAKGQIYIIRQGNKVTKAIIR